MALNRGCQVCSISLQSNWSGCLPHVSGSSDSARNPILLCSPLPPAAVPARPPSVQHVFASCQQPRAPPLPEPSFPAYLAAACLLCVAVGAAAVGDVCVAAGRFRHHSSTAAHAQVQPLPDRQVDGRLYPAVRLPQPPHYGAERVPPPAPAAATRRPPGTTRTATQQGGRHCCCRCCTHHPCSSRAHPQPHSPPGLAAARQQQSDEGRRRRQDCWPGHPQPGAPSAAPHPSLAARRRSSSPFPSADLAQQICAHRQPRQEGSCPKRPWAVGLPHLNAPGHHHPSALEK